MNPPASPDVLPTRTALWVCLAFAAAYFISTLLRAITATLAPVLSAEWQLQARDLGLLASGYFVGFSAVQLPMGRWLDRYGPKRVITLFLSVAVLGCVAFATAEGFYGLLLARVLIGAGLGACLMAPLTGYRRWLLPHVRLRANSWMLMVGALGMVAATLPVQWLLPLWGWRGVFWGLAIALVLVVLVLAWRVPAWPVAAPAAQASAPVEGQGGYGDIWRHRYFQKMALIGAINYGGMIAIQTLWAGPWMVKVAGYTPAQAAQGLFGINVAMLVAFWLWGLVNPRLAQRGWSAERLITWGMPLGLLVLLANVALGPQAGGLAWALFCVCCTFGSLAQPSVALAFPAHMAGRALSAYNLVIFCGVFAVQWGLGLLIDALVALGWAEPQAMQGAMGLYALACVLCYAGYCALKTDNPAP